jgi:molybdate transport system substrate-binding protein
MWVVPQTLYSPIEQDAVVMQKAASNEAAQALMKLLKSPAIKNLIRSYGYDL